MKICLLGNSTGNIDEGMKNITYNISKRLSLKNDVLVLNPLEVLSFSFWKKIGNFNPQVIHYIPGPSIRSFILMKILSLKHRNAKSLMSAPLPKLSSSSYYLLPLFKPDLILVQSEKYDQIFRSKNLNTLFFPLSGIDPDVFVPVPKDQKWNLKDKYGICRDDFVVLHVGHIKKGRNIQVLQSIQERKGYQVVIVGSTSTNVEIELCESLREIGCIILTEYLKNISEIYGLSDCYVFPVVDDLNCIEIPLSVMEAMSCNLPVVTTKFGALPRLFKEGDGFFFIENEYEILPILEILKKDNQHISTRKKALNYSWEMISKKIEVMYEKALK